MSEKRRIITYATAVVALGAAIAGAFALGRSGAVSEPAASVTPTTSTPGSGTVDDVPTLVEAWSDAWNAGDAAAMGALFTDDGTYRDNAFQATFTGPDGASAWVDITNESVGDARIEILDVIATGDSAAVTWIFRGTDIGGFDAATPTQNLPFAVPATSVFTFDGDQISSVTDYYNLADLFRQIGLEAGPWTPPAG